MKLTWKQTSELVAFSSLLLSLIFVGFEVRLSRNVAAAESIATSSATEIELRSLITENHEIWQQGCVGAELSDAELLVFAQIVQSYNTWAYTRWRSSGRGISSLPAIQPPLDVALNLHRFTGFRETWEIVSSQQAAGHPIRLNDFPATGWTDEVKRLYSLLLETDPSPNTDIRLCGI